MAYSTITKPGLHFNTKLYTGNGSTNNITGVGFQPDWVWIKDRTNANSHRLSDSVRGATKYLISSASNAEATEAAGLTAFDSDGFSLGSNSDFNGNSANLVAWNWKANGAGSANTAGSINSTVSLNSTAGFSIVKYTGDGSTGSTVGHGLNAVPDMYITKNRSYAYAWGVYHKDIANDKGLFLSDASAETTGTGFRNSTAPTSSLFTLGGGSQPYRYTSNKSGDEYIGYFFKSVKGYSKIGKYIGSGNANGPLINTGFKPAWVIIKRTDSTGGWEIYDSKRDGFNPQVHGLTANTNNAEDNTDDLVDILSNGFKIRHDGSGLNASNGTYIYAAFAEEPLVANVGNGIPATAR